MGKVRDHIPNDIEGIAQWVCRKFRNHHPMSEREKVRTHARGLPVRELPANFPERQFVTADGRHVGYVLTSGECFKITIEESTVEELSDLGMMKATY